MCSTRRFSAWNRVYRRTEQSATFHHRTYAICIVCINSLSRWMQDNDPEVMDITFSMEEDQFGVIKEVELVPGGGDMAVTQDNKELYIQKVSEYKLVSTVKEQITGRCVYLLFTDHSY